MQLALWLLLAVGAPEGTEPEYPVEVLREAQEISASTLSPFCPGKTLASCPSGKAADWRRDIRAWVAEGIDAETIEAKLQARTPDFEISSVPDSALSWIGPIVLLGLLTLGLAAAAFLTRRPVAAQQAGSASGSGGSPAAAGPNPTTEDQDLLQRELDRLD